MLDPVARFAELYPSHVHRTERMWEAVRQLASELRAEVIEECARVCELEANKYSAAKAIRALSQNAANHSAAGIAESQAPATSEPGDRGVAPTSSAPSAAPTSDQWLVKIEEACRKSKLFDQFMRQNFWSAHYVDLVWRHDGKDIREEADWLVQVWYALRRHVTGQLPPIQPAPEATSETPLTDANCDDRDFSLRLERAANQMRGALRLACSGHSGVCQCPVCAALAAYRKLEKR